MHAVALVLLMAISSAAAMPQQPAGSGSGPLSGEQLLNRWLNRFNALDDWSVSTGEGQSDAVVSAFADLYAPDTIQFAGPEENQIGMVTLSGRDAIRIWAARIARNTSDIAMRAVSRTLDERTASLLAVPAPWGGWSVSMEVTYAYTERASRRRFQIPGAVIIDFGKDEKIRRLRLYLVKDEKEEIYPYDILAR